MFPKKLFLSFFLLLFLFLPFFLQAASFNYVPLEKIPGSEAETSGTTDFYTYVSAIYKFGIWTVGIVALFMLVFGGYTYITSAGNNSSMETAKTIITDAIVGVVMALTAYLLLYVINPDLVKMKKLSPIAGVAAPTVPTMAPTTGPSIPVTGGGICDNGKCTQIDSAIQNNSSGVSPALLKSLLDGGEGCNKANSPKGACGYSQTMPENRSWCGISGTPAETCAKVQNDIMLDINCAAKLISEDFMKRCGTDINQLASCYNTGKKDNCAKAENNYCSRVSAYYASCPK